MSLFTKLKNHIKEKKHILTPEEIDNAVQEYLELANNILHDKSPYINTSHVANINKQLKDLKHFILTSPETEDKETKIEESFTDVLNNRFKLNEEFEIHQKKYHYLKSIEIQDETMLKNIENAHVNVVKKVDTFTHEMNEPLNKAITAEKQWKTCRKSTSGKDTI